MAKGFLAEIMPLAISLFLFALVFIIFFVMLSYRGEQRAAVISSAASKAAATSELLSLLQTPMGIGEITMPIIDAMTFAAESDNPDYKIKVQDEITQHLFFFHPLGVTPLCGYVLSLKDKNAEILAARSIQFSTPTYVKESRSFTISSYRSPGKLYNAELSVECSAY